MIREFLGWFLLAVGFLGVGLPILGVIPGFLVALPKDIDAYYDPYSTQDSFWDVYCRCWLFGVGVLAGIGLVYGFVVVISSFFGG